MSFLKLLWKIVHGYFESHVTRANDALEDRDWLTVVLHLAVVIIVGAVGVLVPIFLVYRFRRLILAIATPIIALAVLIASFYENYKKPRPAMPSSLPIEDVKAKAEETYPLMKQAAYVLFRDLCRYLPGLVPPFSLSSVVAPVKFDITGSLVTIFHFVLAKGANDAPIETIREILEELIDQHLRTQDLPISVPAIYTAADGSTWPGLVVDGIFETGQHYRVDLVITNDAEATRLKARSASRLDSIDTRGQTPSDEDFD